MAGKSAAESLAVGAAVFAVGALVVVPLVKLGQVSGTDGGASIVRVLHAPGLTTAAAHSLLLAAIVPILAVPLGTAMALLLRHAAVPFRRCLRVLMMLPLVVPPFVLGYSWRQAYGRAGLLDSLTGASWTGLEGPVGVAIVLVVGAAPLSFLLASAGLATRAQPDLENAARLSGASTWTTLRTVTLPLLRPVLAAQIVLTFVATLESFAVPQVLGVPAGFSTLTTRIYADLALASDPASFVDAVTLALGLVLIAAVVLLPADFVLAPKLRTPRSGSLSGSLASVLSARSRPTVAAAVGAACYGVATVGLPVFSLVGASITRAVGLPPTPSNWTLANFRSALDAPAIGALSNSVQLAIWAAFVLTALGALVAGLEHRRIGRAAGAVTLVSFAIPGSTLAVGLLIAYGRWLGGSLAIIFAAYLTKFWALAHRTLSGATDRVPKNEWQAARTSGAGVMVAVRTTWLPPLAPALVGAWALVFVSALHEVTMSSLLYSFGNETFAVAVLNSEEVGNIGVTAALCLILTAVILLVAVTASIVLRAMTRRRHRAVTPRALPIGRPEVAGAR